MNRIKDLRKARGMIQRELETALNLGKGNVSKYEKEDHGLSVDNINKLCDYFGVTADYLLCRSNVPTPSAVTEADAELLRAFHAAPEHLQKAARTMLGLDGQADKTKEKSEAS